MTNDQIDAVLGRLRGNYGRVHLDPTLVRELHRALAPLDADVVDQAVTAHIDDSTYFPNVAELLGRIPERQRQHPTPSARIGAKAARLVTDPDALDTWEQDRLADERDEREARRIDGENPTTPEEATA